MAAQQLPSSYQHESTVLQVGRMADSYFAVWLFGSGVHRQAESAYTWARISAARIGAEVHWFAGSGTPDSVTVAADSTAEPLRASAGMRRVIEEFPELAANDWNVTAGYENLSDSGYSRLSPKLTNTNRDRRFPTSGELDLWDWFVTEQPLPFIIEISVYDPPRWDDRALDVAIRAPVGETLTAAQVTQLGSRHLPHLAQLGVVIDYQIFSVTGPDVEVVVGGCQQAGHQVSAESAPFVQKYERC
jgi:hypothetical protein